MFRIIKAFKPRFVIGENVRGIVNIQEGVVFETVCTDLESEGYEVQPFNIPAASVGAPHRRERIWIIAVREETKSNMAESESVRFRGRSGQERGIEKQEFQQSEQERSEVRSEVERRSSQSRTDVANAESSFRNDVQTITGTSKSETQEIFGDGSSIRGESSWWHTEPNVGRVAHGVSGRVHRLKGLGNSIVPQIAEEIGYAIIKAAERTD